MLQRDPSKRLGAHKDAEEIKMHKFFKGIDWEAAKRRELDPPKVKIPEVPLEGVPIESIFGKIISAEGSKINGWSFVSE